MASTNFDLYFPDCDLHRYLGLFGPHSCNVWLLWCYWVPSMMALFGCLRMCCASHMVAYDAIFLELWLLLSIPVMLFLILPVGVSQRQTFIYTRCGATGVNLPIHSFLYSFFLNSLPRFSITFSESSLSLCYALTDINHVTACRNPSHIVKDVP